MAISSKNFVNVTSTFITTPATARDNSGLVISTGVAKTGALGTSYDAGNVVSVSVTTLGDLFATDKPEYQFGVKYFGYVSPSGTAPRLLKFKKIIPGSDTATASVPQGQSGVTAATVTVATFSSKVGGVSGTYEFSYNGTTWKLGDVTANLTQYGITLTGTPASGNKVIVAFEAKGTALVALQDAIGGTESFGSFTFLSASSTGVHDATQLKNAALFNKGLNADYRMCVDVSNDDDDDNYYTAYVSKSGGVVGGDLYGIAGLTLCLGCSYMTMARFAATNYDGANTTSCDMFKGVTPDSSDIVITSDADYNTFNELRINFIGLVKEHGNQWYWYMRGFNMDGTDSACYDNEIWFKSQIVTSLLTLEGSVEKIPANDRGLSMVQANIQGAIDAALSNGTILPNKPLSVAKQQAILAKLDNDTNALAQLMEYGYFILTEIKENGEEYEIDYNVAYLKGDAVRFIQGSHIIV